MRRRLLIARALVHGPDLVLLDEPTVGLDPQVRGDIWTLVDRLRASGVSVLRAESLFGSIVGPTINLVAFGFGFAAW